MENKMIWSTLVHLGNNMWNEEGNYRGRGENRSNRCASPVLRFDRELWDKYMQKLKETGTDTIILDVGEAMRYESHPELLFIVEIKDGGDRGYKACELLASTLESYPVYKDRIVVGTFNDEIEAELKAKYPSLLRGAPTGTAAKFIITQYLGVNLFDGGDFACLQIPMSYDLGIEIPLNKKTLVRRAHRRNIAVQYWTINDPDEMRELIKMGVDCIMTDDPILLKQVLEEFK